MTKFDESLLEFMKAHESIDCLLDIEGNGNFREFDIKRESLFTYVKEDIFRLKERVRYILTFHDDKDHAENAIKYLRDHWIPGKTRLYRKLTPTSNVTVDVHFDEDSLISNFN